MNHFRWLSVAAIAFVAATVSPAGADLTKHYENSLFRITERKLFGVEMLIHDGELKVGTNRVDLIIHDAHDHDVAGAGINVTPWMPDMGHGVTEAPVVTERGGGLYMVENVVFSMAGHWELRIKIAAGGNEDRTTFVFPGVGGHEGAGHGEQGHGGHGTEEDAAQAMANAAKATGPGAEIVTEGGRFVVSYTPEPDPIPLNRIHRWTIAVKTPSGDGVAGAKIRVDGRMPAHGHGLPTQPEVAEEGDGGRYVIEGMKFNMPGLWVVGLRISAPQGEDSVQLPLELQ